MAAERVAVFAALQVCKSKMSCGRVVVWKELGIESSYTMEAPQGEGEGEGQQSQG